MATTAAQDKLRKQLIIQTTDYRGNEVICTQKTWNSHISVDHPQMRGRQDEVKATLADPALVYPSTISDKALIYESDALKDTIPIRVVVTFDDIAQHGAGSTI